MHFIEKAAYIACRSVFAGQFQRPEGTIKLMKISLNGVQRMMFLTFFPFCRPGHENFFHS
jgi:hypothetical protein